MSQAVKDPLKTPMMEQYLKIKAEYPDSILFFRMGDFYEMFLEDAEIASRILDIVLTKRQNKLPMCGIPFHAQESYIGRLLRAGRKIAICEQMGEPGVKLMERRVVRVITPGTVVEENLLGGKAANYIAALYFSDKQSRLKGRVVNDSRLDHGAVDLPDASLVLVDVSTGDFFWACGDRQSRQGLDTATWVNSLLGRFQPGELLVIEDHQHYLEEIQADRALLTPVSFQFADQKQGRRRLLELFKVHDLHPFGVDDKSPLLACVNILLGYVETTGELKLENFIKYPRRLDKNATIQIDAQTVRHLELVYNYQENSRERTLLTVLNHTVTAAGRRLLEYNLLNPSGERTEIENRQNQTAWFVEQSTGRDRASILLEGIGDLERMLARFSMNKALPKDFGVVMHSLAAAFELDDLLVANHFVERLDSRPQLEELAAWLNERIDPEVDLPAALHQSPFLRTGFDPDLDEQYRLKKGGSELIIAFQDEMKRELGATTLKVRYNKVIGYFIEVSKREAPLVPTEWLRKQTLVSSERFTSQSLQDLEVKILRAEEEIESAEQKYFTEIVNHLLENSRLLLSLTAWVAAVDYSCSLALAAGQNNWTRAEFAADFSLTIEKGRHPVVEYFLRRQSAALKTGFIPNNIYLEGEERQIAVITGPNMAGKSTYIRQCALIQLLFQAGSFVPAERAVLPVVDRIYTRIGASDNLSRGHSTFMVEMLETAQILNSCTSQSLVLMDEVGRGTATWDGLSLAWAILHYLNGQNERAKRPLTMFATHYHELTRLGIRRGFFNLTMDVLEKKDEVIFLRSVSEGIARKSYGLHVARMAGIPASVIKDAQKIMDDLEKSSSAGHAQSAQLDLFANQLSAAPAEQAAAPLDEGTAAALEQLRSIDTDSMTPLEALNLLQSLKSNLEEG